MPISDETGSLRVVALDGDAVPAAGAAVMIVDSPSGHDDIAGLTDARGRVVFEPLAPGVYRVRARSHDGRSIEGAVSVRPDELSVVHLQLRASDPPSLQK